MREDTDHRSDVAETPTAPAAPAMSWAQVVGVGGEAPVIGSISLLPPTGEETKP